MRLIPHRELRKNSSRVQVPPNSRELERLARAGAIRPQRIAKPCFDKISRVSLGVSSEILLENLRGDR
jgi:hypothetical protein